MAFDVSLHLTFCISCITVGFQTARQLNNKLKEPNRMKKDLLTQMSINSFFSASAIKREPEDNDAYQNQTAQNAKKRKIENAEVMVKSEPMDTEQSESTTQQVNVKPEPEDYDSDANTEAESDDDVDTRSEMRGNDKMGNRNTNPIKVEQNSDVDTDEASDDDETTVPNFANDNRKSATNNDAMKVKQPKNYPNNQHETIERRSRPKQRLVSDRQNGFERHPIKTEPVTSHVSTSEMIVSEPIKFNDNIKTEPADDPIRSDEETDDENQGEQMNTLQNPPIKTEVLYDEYYKNQANIQNYQYQQQAEQEPTANGIYDSFASTSKDVENMPVAPSAEMYYCRQPKSNTQPLITVGTRSTKSVNAADGTPILRFNHFETVVNEEPQVNVLVDDDDDDDDDMSVDLIGEFETYVKDYPKQIEKELAELKKCWQTDLKNLSSTQLNEMRKKLDQLNRKKKIIYTQKLEEESQKTKEEKERIRDEFVRNLFGPYFNILALEQKFVINIAQRSQRPSTSQQHATTDQKEMKSTITYNEFMNKTNINSEQPKLMKGPLFNMAANNFVHEKQEKHKLNEVPKQVIKIIKDEKTEIKKRVDKFLMPYFKNKTINKVEYEKICQIVTKHQYESHDYGKSFFDLNFFGTFQHEFN